ncbi:nitrite reductase small subunit NirD [Pigmentiphaga soli]|uniref:Nitrite reductase small subunit NirD n=1 Tax=Pigmentiphaga soli TaxID=1007095 RepID=A0ABP8H4N2_9BURK
MEASTTESEWIHLGASEDFGAGCPIVERQRRRFVVAILDNRIFAFDALCPHAFGPMHLAEVQGTVVTCPLHAWRFDLEQDGRELHGYRGLQTYAVKQEGGQVYIAKRPA